MTKRHLTIVPDPDLDIHADGKTRDFASAAISLNAHAQHPEKLGAVKVSEIAHSDQQNGSIIARTAVCALLIFGAGDHHGDQLVIYKRLDTGKTGIGIYDERDPLMYDLTPKELRDEYGADIVILAASIADRMAIRASTS